MRRSRSQKRRPRQTRTARPPLRGSAAKMKCRESRRREVMVEAATPKHEWSPIFGYGIERRLIAWKPSSDPGLSRSGQRCAERGPRRYAALHEIRRLERKCRRGPTLRQRSKRMPLGIVSGGVRMRPAEQHAIGELLRSQTIEQRLPRLFAVQWRNPSPSFAHGCKTLVLAVRKPQPLP